MSAMRMYYIDRSFKYIVDDIQTKDLSDNLSISADTLLKVNRSLRISGLFQMSNYHELIKQIENTYSDKTVNYSICNDGKFLNLTFLELRNK